MPVYPRMMTSIYDICQLEPARILAAYSCFLVSVSATQERDNITAQGREISTRWRLHRPMHAFLYAIATLFAGKSARLHFMATATGIRGFHLPQSSKWTAGTLHMLVINGMLSCHCLFRSPQLRYLFLRSSAALNVGVSRLRLGSPTDVQRIGALH